MRKNREKPRDFYANDAVWDAVYRQAVPGLKHALDVAYLTGQRPSDVLMIRQDDIEGDYLVVQQNKMQKKLRIILYVDGVANSLGTLTQQMDARNQHHISSYLIASDRGSGRQLQCCATVGTMPETWPSLRHWIFRPPRNAKSPE